MLLLLLLLVLLGRLRQVLPDQRLGYNQDHERQNENEKEPALGARILLRIFIVGQSFLRTV